MRAASILAGGAASARASRPSLLASVLQAASSHFPNASTRRRDGPAAPAQNIRWRRDPKPRDFASRGARDAKKGEAQKIKSKAMDRLRPPRPALTFGEKGLALTHTPPTYASHVALYLYDADGKKRLRGAQAAGRRRRRRLRRRTRDEEAAAGRPHRFTGHRYVAQVLDHDLLTGEPVESSTVRPRLLQGLGHGLFQGRGPEVRRLRLRQASEVERLRRRRGLGARSPRVL